MSRTCGGATIAERSVMTKGLVAFAVVLLCGCDLYFGGGDDEPCPPYGRDGLAPAQELRNPNTGQCEYYGGNYPCDGVCGPCEYDDPGVGASPNWGACYGHCSGLDEGTCFITAGCYAAYLEDPAADGKRDFWGCWNTVADFSVPSTGCYNLDAQQCSQNDTCIAVYAGFDQKTAFQSCEPEPPTYCVTDAECGPYATCDTTQCHAPPCPDCPNCGACPDVCYGVCVPTGGTCANVDCGPGQVCKEQCYGTNGMAYCEPVCVEPASCAAIDCGPGYMCTEVCELDSNGQWSCHGTCVPTNDPGQCTGPVNCFITPPVCPAGTTPGIANGCYTGYCIPTNKCTPNDPGECYGQVSCAMVEPSCPSGTVPGVRNGCWTGYCIPTSACPLAACSTLTSESACTARTDCIPVYDGMDCTCYPTHCECKTLTYARCESL